MRRSRRRRLWFILAGTASAALAAGDGPPTPPPLQGPAGAIARRLTDRATTGPAIPRLLPPRGLERPGRTPTGPSPADANADPDPTEPGAATLPPVFDGPADFGSFPTTAPPGTGNPPPLPPRQGGLLPPNLAPTLEGPRTLRLETVPDEALDPRLSPFGSPAGPTDLPRFGEGTLAPYRNDEGGPGGVLPRPRNAGRMQNSTETPTREGLKPKGDPAEDSALQRKVEEQVRIAAGRHLRSVDVRVVDQKVKIHLRVDRFWLRRSIRRNVEALPALTGVSATVEVD